MILSWVLSGCMDQTSHKHESSQGDSGRDTGFDQFVAMVLKAYAVGGFGFSPYVVHHFEVRSETLNPYSLLCAIKI